MKGFHMLKLSAWHKSLVMLHGSDPAGVMLTWHKHPRSNWWEDTCTKNIARKCMFQGGTNKDCKVAKSKTSVGFACNLSPPI